MTAISIYQFAKAAILLLIPTLFVLDPSVIRNSPFLSQMVFIAARGRNIPAVLMPIIGIYVAYIGFGLWRLRNGARHNVLIGSFLTVAISLARLGVFDSILGTGEMQSIAGQQPLLIVIFLDAVIFIYLAFHPDITDSFTRKH